MIPAAMILSPHSLGETLGRTRQTREVPGSFMSNSTSSAARGQGLD